MVNRKRTVVVYGRGTDGTKGDFIVVRELLYKGYDVVWAVQIGNKSRESFFEMEELLESEGLYDHLRVLSLDSSGLQSYIGDTLNFKFDGSAPYAMIHMGLLYDEKLSEDDPINHYCENVQNTLSLLKLYGELGMRKFIVDCAYDLLSEDNYSIRSVCSSLMCVKDTLRENEFRTITYSDVVGVLPYSYIDVDGEEKEKDIVLGNDDTCIINIVNSLESNSDGNYSIDLNEEIYSSRLGYAIKSNGIRNYVFGPDLANLHIALLNRDFDSNIPVDLYVGVTATTKEVLDAMSSKGELEYKFVPEEELDEDKKPILTSNVPETLVKEGMLTEINQILC